MTLLTSFNWQDSVAHVYLLSRFATARDPARVLGWQFIRTQLGESVEDALARLEAEQMLVPANINESVGCLLKVSDLKKILSDSRARTSGSKRDLVDRVVEIDPARAQQLAATARVLRCSAEAARFLEAWEAGKRREARIAKQECFIALQSGDAKRAGLVYATFMKRFSVDSTGTGQYSFERLFEDIGPALQGSPKALGDVSNDDLHRLQVAGAMARIWQDAPEQFLDRHVETAAPSIAAACNWIAVNGKARHDLAEARKYTRRVRVHLEIGSLECCDLHSADLVVDFVNQ